MSNKSPNGLTIRSSLSRIISLTSTFTFVFFAFTSAEARFLDPDLKTWMSEKESAQQLLPSIKEVIVYLKPDASFQAQGITADRSMQRMALTMQAEEITQSLSSYSKEYETLWSSNAVIMKIDRASLKKLVKNGLVDGVVLNKTIMLDEPKASESKRKVNADQSQFTYGLQLIHAPEAWEKGSRGEEVVVGIIDTGIDADHPDLKGKVVMVKDFTKDNDGKDYHGHGTHVAGTIVGGNASGTQIGVAPSAKVIMAKVFDSEGRAELAGLLKAMEFMVDPDGDPLTKDAPRVVSNSWGSSSQFVYAFKNVIQVWRDHQIFPSFAAGNSGSSYLTINAPGSYPHSYAVGAVDENGELTSFSSRGPVIWLVKKLPRFITKPNISAPGYNVKSSVPGGAWAEYSGTSMATPHLSGVVALALAAAPELTIEKLTEILNSSVLDKGPEGMDNRYGYGIVQADQVVAKAKSWRLSLALSSQGKAHNR